VGIGELPDADRYGDRGSNTLGHIAHDVGLSVPTLRSLGLGRVVDLGGSNPPAAAALAAYGRMAAGNATARYARDFLITDGESASVTDVQRATGREMIIRLAQFARFRDGKAYEFCSIIDTLGAAEQVVGRPLIVDAPALAE